MKSTTAISTVVALILALTSMSSLAQQGPRGGANSDRAQQVGRERTYDQNRTRIVVPEQERGRIKDPANMNDQDIYGNELMTTSERNRYRKELGNSKTPAARREFQVRHEAKMQERALLKGVRSPTVRKVTLRKSDLESRQSKSYGKGARSGHHRALKRVSRRSMDCQAMIGRFP